MPGAAGPSPLESLLNALLALLRRIFKPFLDWLSGVAGGGRSIGVILGILLAIVAIAAVTVLILRIVDALADTSPRARGGGAAATGALAQARSAADWRALAERAAASRDYAAAIVALFSAALATLDEASLVPFDSARTPGEYRRMLRRVRWAAGDPFDVLAESFVRAAFDARPVDDGDYVRALHAYDDLRPLAA